MGEFDLLIRFSGRDEQHRIGDKLTPIYDDVWGGIGSFMDGVYRGWCRIPFRDDDPCWIVVKEGLLHKTLPVQEGESFKEAVRRIKKNYGLKNPSKSHWSEEAWDKTKRAEKFIRKYQNWLDFGDSGALVKEEGRARYKKAEALMGQESEIQEAIQEIEKEANRSWVDENIFHPAAYRFRFPWRPEITGMDQEIPEDMWEKAPEIGEWFEKLNRVTRLTYSTWGEVSNPRIKANKILELEQLQKDMVRAWWKGQHPRTRNIIATFIPKRLVTLLETHFGIRLDTFVADLPYEFYSATAELVRRQKIPRLTRYWRTFIHMPFYEVALREGRKHAAKYNCDTSRRFPLRKDSSQEGDRATPVNKIKAFFSRR